jgi:hypothetical protein
VIKITQRICSGNWRFEPPKYFLIEKGEIALAFCVKIQEGMFTEEEYILMIGADFYWPLQVGRKLED